MKERDLQKLVYSTKEEKINYSKRGKTLHSVTVKTDIFAENTNISVTSRDYTTNNYYLSL